MRRVSFYLLLLGGATAGFFGTLRLIEEKPPGRPVMPVNIDLKFSARDYLQTSLGPGWQKPERWGVWAEGKEAVAVAPMLGQARGDVAIFVEGRNRSPASGEQERVTVLVNGETVGVWQLNAAGNADFASFVVPAKTANGREHMQIAFRAARPVFGLARIQVRDIHSLLAHGGHVDNCQPDRISGWARVENLPSPIVVRRNGAVVMPLATRNVSRPDLSQAGAPSEAGFEIILPPPQGRVERIDVTFPNGQPLPNSPCRVS